MAQPIYDDWQGMYKDPVSGRYLNRSEAGGWSFLDTGETFNPEPVIAAYNVADVASPEWVRSLDQAGNTAYYQNAKTGAVGTPTAEDFNKYMPSEQEFFSAGGDVTPWGRPNNDDDGFLGLGDVGNLLATVGTGLLLGPAGVGLSGAALGAATGGVSGLLTGGDPLKGALLGGVTGGIGSELFGGGVDSATRDAMMGLGDTTADLGSGLLDTAALGAGQIGSLPVDTATRDLMSGLGDTPVDTATRDLMSGLGDTPVETAITDSWGSPYDMAKKDFEDFGVRGVESLGQGYNSNIPSAPDTFSPTWQTTLADRLRDVGIPTNAALTTATGLTSAGTALDKLVNKDPFRAAQIAMGLGGLLAGATAKKPEDEAPYVSTPINKDIVAKYGKIPDNTSAQYQPIKYQGFQTLSMPQGLLDERLSRMRRGLI